MARSTMALCSRLGAILATLVVYGALDGRIPVAQASDPELIRDFAVPPGVNASYLDGNYFTYTGFRNGVMAQPGNIAYLQATVDQFPALDGLGISFFIMNFQPGGVLPPHIHPRGSKLIYVLEGTLIVGFIDNKYKNYNQTLVKGDLYVVPKAMIHYMANIYSDKPTTTLFGFSSSNPGTIQVAAATFGSDPKIPDGVLQRTFGVDQQQLQYLEGSFLKI